MPDVADTTDQYTNLLDAIEAKHLSVKKAQTGQTIVNKSGGYEIKVLGPKQGTASDDLNGYSAVIQVEYKDNSFLFTGDAFASDLLNDVDGHIDVLKAAHHGSETGTSTELLNKVTPQYVVLSYGEGNDYGHPSQDVLDNLKSINAKVVGTGANGVITIKFNGKDIDVKLSKDGEVTAGVSVEERQKQEEEKKAQEEAEAKKQHEEAAAAQQEQQAAEAAAAEQEQQAVAAQQQSQEMTVFVTRTGKKYHQRGCRTLARSKSLEEVTISEAESRGLGPCEVCFS